MNKKIVALLTLVLGLFAGLTTQSAQASWWSPDWAHRNKITLNTADTGAAIKAPVDAVPVLIRLHTGNFAFADANANGSDLRFIAGDDKTPLKYHIEKFDGLNELALVWVQVPKLAPNTKDDAIWLYYGNPKAPAGDDVKGTYDSAQAVVLHFGEKDGQPKDATANANNAAQSTATPSAAGLIGGAMTFNGTAKISIAGAPSLKLGPTGMTVSMWVKPNEAAGTAPATLFAQQEGNNLVSLSLQGDKLFAAVNGAASSPAGSVPVGAWHHVALVVKDGFTVYLDGQPVGQGGGATVSMGGDLTVGQGFKGDIDEVEVAYVARTAEWIRAASAGQGADQKLLVYGAAEGGDGGDSPSVFKVLIGSVTIDGWVVIGILLIMMVISFTVMVGKAIFLSRTLKANRLFKDQFAALGDDLTALDMGGAKDVSGKPVDLPSTGLGASSMYRMYHIGVHELQARFASYRAKGRELVLTPQSIDAIRASLDAGMVRELQRLNSQIVLLTIAIAGGPFLGLLGTVVGVMITFGAIALAGDVNVNAIAPGIAAALVATVAGLAVAIPSLFGYNYLVSKIKEVSADMQVFADEFITRVAENHSV